MKRSWFVRGDIDGFFGLFIDNLVQLMLITALCDHYCKIPREIIVGRMLPAAAISILVGNLFYAWQARRLMRKTGRQDVTALPYGINTPSVIAYIFLIMYPVYQRSGDWHLAWQAGLFACVLSGVIETAGAFVGDWLRRYTPRAALLSALAGIAITFIAMLFVFQLFAYPEIGLLPMLIIVLAYAARAKLPLRLPAGLLAVVVGTALAWVLMKLGWTAWQPDPHPYAGGIYLPKPVPKDVFALFAGPSAWSFLSVIIPMGLFNVIGSLQNLESAEAAGDRYETRPSLLANGIGTLVAAFLGSAFPTTIYIGHPGWKALGARAGYSVLNGVLITVLCLVGGVTAVLKIVPLEAALGILLWIGIIITAQAFEAVPRRHALAVAFGLVPALGGWALHLVRESLGAAGAGMAAFQEALAQRGLFLHGILALDSNGGYILLAMVWAAIMVFAIDRRFLMAAGWSFATAILSLVGIIHGYQLTETGIQPAFFTLSNVSFAVMYALAAVLLILLHRASGTTAVSATTADQPAADAGQ